MANDPLITGRDESTPFRAFNRVFLAVAVVFVVVCALAYGLCTALN